MRTSLTILGIAGGVVLLVLLGVAIAVWTVDPNQFIGPIQARINASTGRDIAIKGGIDLKLGLEPKLVVNDVRAARAQLLARGVDVTPVLAIGPQGQREATADEDLNNRGFCFFKDPDGNGWAVQQITSRA